MHVLFHLNRVQRPENVGDPKHDGQVVVNARDDTSAACRPAHQGTRERWRAVGLDLASN